MDTDSPAATSETAKLRMTPQRRTILRELRILDAHPAADEVYELVRRQLPKISLGTVYRNLDVLSKAGLISRICLGDGQRRYDGRVHRHYHVRCVECGKISDVSEGEFGDLDAAARSACEFEILSHQLQFEGLCKDCKNCKDCRESGQSK